MTHDEQHRMIVELLDSNAKMKRRDEEEFLMFVKRDKDDEDLDTVSQKRLQALYETYLQRSRR